MNRWTCINSIAITVTSKESLRMESGAGGIGVGKHLEWIGHQLLLARRSRLRQLVAATGLVCSFVTVTSVPVILQASAAGSASKWPVLAAMPVNLGRGIGRHGKEGQMWEREGGGGGQEDVCCG